MRAVSPSERDQTTRVRREPPRFRPVIVRRVAPLSARMVRVTLTGPELEGLAVEQPAASVRLLLPSRGTVDLVVPTWRGNEFLLPDGMHFEYGCPAALALPKQTEVPGRLAGLALCRGA